eukprot:CAMPEP_0204822122 /NCGR_PEP_ID=MMETSP1346-20131115/297_1 /ASSEMBLY_ACC=CAM_ASM_000771 /TAXON_ID=215587 /ORGANISM="Aplanochytrium stocchinoi, Strain GSBS06" /LENGTH=443 /DNA_ID=CAMNT_0051948159 /DNA_START=273 /DNA_END=1604 /DNA_ORIENTATION=-
MTECLADEYGRANIKHERLYTEWAKGGCGLLITGNVQIDRRYLERPGNVCIDGPQDEQQMEGLRKFAKAASVNGTVCFAQISHPGRQANLMVATKSPAPSAIQSGGLVPLPKPFEMSNSLVKETIQKYAKASKVCKEAGFGGVQLHSAHGYLLSSFLNPNANSRTDEYGGTLENRARALIETIRAVRKAVGNDYPVGIKINTSDFQKGGFSHEDALIVAEWLDREKLDFIEVSGGNYEQPVLITGEDNLLSDMVSVKRIGKKSTVQREAYFLKYARDIKKVLKRTPLMVTGGFRSRKVMESALNDDGISMIGLGRPLCLTTDCVNDLLDGKVDTLRSPETQWKLPWYVSWLRYLVVGNLMKVGGDQASTYWNLYRSGDGLPMEENPNMLLNMIRTNYRDYQVAVALKGLPKDDPTLQQNKPKSNLPKVILAIVIAYFVYRTLK